MCGVLAAVLIGTAVHQRADHGLLFGAATVFTALTAIAAVVSVFARKHVEDQAGRTFALLAVLSVILLVLVAHDWARRQLLVTALVAATVLSVFIVRVGFESLKVPPQWERAQIADRAEEEERALSLQHMRDVPVLKQAAMNARMALGDIVNGSPAPNVDSDLLNAARKILGQAYALIQKGEAENADDFSQFDALVADESPVFPPAATTTLADAVHALQAAESAAAAPASSKSLDRAICVVNPPPSGKCGPGPIVRITTNQAWVTDQHELNVDLATYRAQVTGTQADQSALQAVLAQQPDANEDISILAAIENGPQSLWRSAFHAAGPALVPGPLGWVLLGAALLWLLGWLLKVNASQLTGPVSVMTPASGATDQLTAALRVAVLENVAEPGAAPGSPSTNPVTTLLDIAAGPLSAVGKIVQAIQAVAGQRYGYQVTVDITSGDLAGAGLVSAEAGAASPPPAADTAVLVRVMSLSSGLTYASQLCTAPDPIVAVRTAGLWAAGFILNRSSRIPHWAAWQAATAHALVTVKNKADHTIPALKAALADAPNSGILLVLLGHQCELEGQALDAIEYYARAVTAYPRYGVARYRLAAALASMQHANDWRSPDQVEQQEDMLRAVESATKTLGVNDSEAMKKLETRKDAATGFKELAHVLFQALEFDTGLAWRLVGAMRRSERESIWPALVPASQHPAARFPHLVRSARQAISDKPDERHKLNEDADEKDSWWQISYNAACATATSIKPDDKPDHGAADGPVQTPKEKEDLAGPALRFLEQTLVRPGVEQLSAVWVRQDPDLAPLRSLPRFKRFLTQLRPGE